jgi:hypothetical protein
MASPTGHEIDPDYDTVIVLTDPCKHFASWSSDAENSDVRSQDGSYELPGNVAEQNTVERQKTVAEQERGAESSRDHSALTGDDTEAVDNDEVSATKHHRSATIDVVVADVSVQSTGQETELIHYRVSSRHLNLASPWFKRTLTSRFREAFSDSSDGHYYVNATEWDEEALLNLLNALHVQPHSSYSKSEKRPLVVAQRVSRRCVTSASNDSIIVVSTYLGIVMRRTEAVRHSRVR